MSPLLLFSLGLLLGTCLLAWRVGDRPEREGAVLYAFAWLVFDLILIGSHRLGLGRTEQFSILLNLLSDLVLAIGLLVIALKYMSLWLGAAMWIQSLCFVIHALMLDGESAGQRIYISATNLLSFAVLGCLLFGSLVSWRRRVKARRGSTQDDTGAQLQPSALSPAG